MNVSIVPALALSAVGFSSASAQNLLIPNSNTRVIMEFSSVTGALLNPVAMDLAALTGGAARTPIEVLEAPNGELWVSDQTADTVFRLSSDGTTFLGTVSAPLDNCRGLCLSGAGVMIANSGTGGGAGGDTLVQMNAGGDFVSATNIGDPYDVEPFTFNGVPGFLVSDILGEDLVFAQAADPTNQTVFHASNGISGIDTPQQIHVSSTGRIFAASSSTPVGVFEYDSAGAQVDYINVSAIAGLGGVRGVFELEDGNILFTTGSGVHVYDSLTATIRTEISGVSGRMISRCSEMGCPFTSYCVANSNSTGRPGMITVTGSPFAADNSFALTASGLPTASFGYFLTSRTQGFVANPSGSAGNLCLSGSIGRYVGPGEIQNSGPSGSFTLALDLTQVPQPNGFVAVVAGETWNYQTWFRDAIGGSATSNFTDGVSVSFR